MNNQEEAFKKLSKLKCGALFMEMGTGKTKVALDLINYKYKKIEYILWICPFSIKNEIESERLKWHPHIQMDIIGCESIGSSDRTYLDVYNKVISKKTFIIVDESIKIKNSEAKRTSRILELGEHSEYRLILNGTPVSKNVIDLWTQMQFLSPKILQMTELEFKNTFCEYYIKGKQKGLVKAQYNIPYLISLIEPYIFDSKLSLTIEKEYKNLYYEHEDLENYNNIKNGLLSSLRNDYIFDFFAVATELQKTYINNKYKNDRINEIIMSKAKEKFIIYVKYLNSIPENAHRLTGKENLKQRKRVLKDFENGIFTVLYITYGVGSYGLNLQYCNNIIFADHTFDYGQKIQSEFRIFRLGQDKNCSYYNLWCKCGIDNFIKKCLDKKTNLLDEIRQEIAKGDVEEWLKNI